MSGAAVYFKGKDVQSQTFTSNGTFNVPDGVYQVFVEMYGGGGGGGSARNTTGETLVAVYGGEAGDRVQTLIPTNPGDSISVTIGSGGAGATNRGRGDNGTATLFGSFRAAGGKGGGLQVDGPSELNGTGIGRDNFRSVGGVSTLGFNVSSFGGDAGYGNGGDTGSGSGANGGLGAGGGSRSLQSSLVGDAGSGGNGICIVYWVEE